MAIIMRLWKNGELVGRCDAKCYNSTADNCLCICMGRFHNLGRNRAVTACRKNKSYFRSFYHSDYGYSIDFY